MFSRIRMRGWLIVLAAALVLAGAVPSARADVFDLNLANCPTVGICGLASSFGTVTLTQSGSGVQVDVAAADGFGLFGFWFNVEPDADLSISGLPAPWESDASPISPGSIGGVDGFGKWEFEVNTPSAATATSSVSFLVTKYDGTTLDMSELETGSTKGYYFAAHVIALGDTCPEGQAACTGFATTGDTVVPEPATALLMGLGLLGVSFVIRRRRA